jgi:type IV pilus assembly protein PilB
VSSQRLVRKICQQCIKHNAGAIADCSVYKGSGYFGRIGVHEVLSKAHLFNPSIANISMRDAGFIHMQAGLINPAALDAEVSRWH